MSIRELREAVERGEATTMRFDDVFGGVFTERFGCGADVAETAYFGDLECAKALHDAVLPGRSWTLEDHGGFVADIWLGVSGDDDFHLASGRSDNPARAWLIAILRALEAQEDA